LQISLIAVRLAGALSLSAERAGSSIGRSTHFHRWVGRDTARPSARKIKNRDRYDGHDVGLGDHVGRPFTRSVWNQGTVGAPFLHPLHLGRVGPPLWSIVFPATSALRLDRAVAGTRWQGWLLPFALLIVVGTAVTMSGAARPVLENLLSLVLSAAAGAGCARAALRSAGDARTGWWLIAFGCWSWAAGQAAWTVLQVLLGVELPFPSVADIGYGAFPICVTLGLWRLTRGVSRLAMARRVIDGFTVGCSLGLAAWVFVLERLVDGDFASPLAEATSLFYPVTDIVLVTVAVLTIAQTRELTASWVLLGLGVLAMTLADFTFAYQIAAGTFQTGSFVAWGWWVGFTSIGTAGLVVVSGGLRTLTAGPQPLVPARASLLPYLPLAGGVLAAAHQAFSHQHESHATELILVAAVVALVLLRQYMTVRENQLLTRAVQERELKLHHMAFHDVLTGLANRALFLDRLGHALDLAAHNRHAVSVAFLDLDGFKAINDSLGHAAGDQLLVRVAERLQGALRTAETLARLGGDEFAVVVEQEEEATSVAEAMLAALQPPFQIDTRAVTVSASIGVASVQPCIESAQPAALLHRADMAMYAAKSSGTGRMQVHTPVLDLLSGEPVQALELRRALVASLQAGEIHPWYQPIVNVHTGRIEMLEALARWTCGGLTLPADVFVPVAIEAGLADRLTATVIEQACVQLSSWNEMLGHRRLRVAVNLHPTEFSDSTMPERLFRLMDTHALARDQIVLEITELAPSNRPDAAIEVVHQLRAAGVQLALDDFGTGFSSLRRMATMPVDVVKIDRFFVVDVEHDRWQQEFMRAVLEFARRLGLRTVAEGVERASQADVLRELGCDMMQGYLVARPAPPDDLLDLLLTDGAPPAPVPSTAGGS
jgi:diguanylate cyclase (GGDEF)-like protein